MLWGKRGDTKYRRIMSDKIKIEGIGDKRTIQQNRALHKFLSQLSDQLNEHGCGVVKVIKAYKQGVEIQFTPELVKEIIWREIQLAITGRKSTKDLLKNEEIEKIHQIIVKFIGEKFGIEVPPFPSQESQELNKLNT